VAGVPPYDEWRLLRIVSLVLIIVPIPALLFVGLLIALTPPPLLNLYKALMYVFFGGIVAFPLGLMLFGLSFLFERKSKRMAGSK
jgi:Na+/proline symporter